MTPCQQVSGDLGNNLQTLQDLVSEFLWEGLKKKEWDIVGTKVLSLVKAIFTHAPKPKPRVSQTSTLLTSLSAGPNLQQRRLLVSFLPSGAGGKMNRGWLCSRPKLLDQGSMSAERAPLGHRHTLGTQKQARSAAQPCTPSLLALGLSCACSSLVFHSTHQKPLGTPAQCNKATCSIQQRNIMHRAYFKNQALTCNTRDFHIHAKVKIRYSIRESSNWDARYLTLSKQWKVTTHLLSQLAN